MTGGGGGGGAAEVAEAQPAAPAYSQQYAQQPMQQDINNPCGLELRQFMECAQGQSDISLCQGFNEVLRECRLRSGTFLVGNKTR
jgi:hypothetical protein